MSSILIDAPILSTAKWPGMFRIARMSVIKCRRRWRAQRTSVANFKLRVSLDLDCTNPVPITRMCSSINLGGCSQTYVSVTIFSRCLCPFHVTLYSPCDSFRNKNWKLIRFSNWKVFCECSFRYYRTIWSIENALPIYIYRGIHFYAIKST